ncbi:hypothetical protein OIU84_028863 [Salix udensis]|uniref:Pentatricopeptide repeat-containing protein n=1 Tax=Salix udensis TaxID=889485 RepID=A0AAD6P9T9_9ROSI|nr:hypothetical protein OIU84_028863 [Salix udensis]
MTRFLANLKSSHSSTVFNHSHKIITFSYSSQTTQPFPPKTFFKSNTKDTTLVPHLCNHKRFDEAIHILCQQNRLKDALQILHQIEKPSASVYSTLIQSCIKNRLLQQGKKVHQHIKLSGFVPGLFILNRLLEMYAKCDSLMDSQKLFDEMHERDLCSWNVLISGYAKMGLLQEAKSLFDKMPERDNFSWTAMISGYVRHDRPNEALELFRMMKRGDNSKSNKFTVSSALAAAAAVPCMRIGKEIHGYIMRTGLDSDEVVWSALSDMYGKCGSIEEARHIFDMMADRDIVTWTAMIDRD